LHACGENRPAVRHQADIVSDHRGVGADVCSKKRKQPKHKAFNANTFLKSSLYNFLHKPNTPRGKQQRRRRKKQQKRQACKRRLTFVLFKVLPVHATVIKQPLHQIHPSNTVREASGDKGANPC